jgi:CHAD domain-containing protein
MHWILENLDQVEAILAEFSSKYTFERMDQPVQKMFFLDDFEHHIVRNHANLSYFNEQYRLCLDGKQSVLDADCICHFASDFPASEFKQCVSDLIGVRKLEPIAKMDVGRYQLVVRDYELKKILTISIAWVQGLVLLELIPVRGYGKAVRKFEKILAKYAGIALDAPLQMILLQKSGFQPSNYSLKPDVVLDPEMSSREAVAYIARVALEIGRVNEPGIIRKSEDTEYLHDYRVCLRKVRSIVNLLKDVYPPEIYIDLKSRLGALSRRTNRLRDVDVYLLERERYTHLLPLPLRQPLSVMFDDFEKEQKLARRAIKSWLSSKAYAEEIRALLAIFDEHAQIEQTQSSQSHIKGLVCAKALKRYRKIMRIGSQITPETPDDDVHMLRIECKKFRYLLDFFETLYDREKIEQLRKKLRRLQNTLGKFNDFSVQQKSLGDYVTTQHDVELVKSIGALIMVLSQKQQEQRNKVEVRFSEFSNDETAHLVDTLFNRNHSSVKSNA